MGFARHFYFFDNFDNGVSPFIRDVFLEDRVKDSLPEVVHALLAALRTSYRPLNVFAALLIFRGDLKFVGGELQPYLVHSLPLQ